MKPRLVVLAVLCAALAGCGHMPKIWPFHKKAKPGPEAVNELNLVNADGSAASYPQYWSRNTLVIDLSGVTGTGNVAARLPPDTTWPVRMAVRVRPRDVQQIEILGEERNVLPVATDGAKPIDLELAPSVYTPRTAAIYISWGPMPVFAEVASATDTAAAPPRRLPPNTVPRLTIVWNCDDCKRDDKVISQLQQGYREAARKKGLTISDVETADVFIVGFGRGRSVLGGLLGYYLSAKDRLSLKVRFRGQLLETGEQSAMGGEKRVYENLGKQAIDWIKTVR